MRLLALTPVLALVLALATYAETYWGIKIAPEHCCALYDRADYRLLAVAGA